jgi:hypothetical protein
MRKNDCLSLTPSINDIVKHAMLDDADARTRGLADHGLEGATGRRCKSDNEEPFDIGMSAYRTRAACTPHSVQR